MAIRNIGEASLDPALIGKRDAFHMAGVLVMSHQDLLGGEHLRFTDANCTKVVSATSLDRHAIVDPFIRFAPAGTVFWALLVPGMTANLVHTFDIKGMEPLAEAVKVSIVGEENAKLQEELARLMRLLDEKQSIIDEYNDADTSCPVC